MRPIRAVARPATIALLVPAALILAACAPSDGVGVTDPSPNATLEQRINEPTDGLANEITVE